MIAVWAALGSASPLSKCLGMCLSERLFAPQIQQAPSMVVRLLVSNGSLAFPAPCSTRRRFGWDRCRDMRSRIRGIEATDDSSDDRGFLGRLNFSKKEEQYGKKKQFVGLQGGKTFVRRRGSRCCCRR